MEVDPCKTGEKINNNEGETEESEEDMLVYMKFEDLNDDYSNVDLSNCRIIGIDSDEPIVQIGNKAFGGTWEEAVGTPTFFEEIPSTPKRCYFSKEVKKPLQYVTKTHKCLSLKRIFITPKEPKSETNENLMNVDESEDT